MSELAAKTVKPSSNHHRNGVGEKNSGKGNNPFIQPKEGGTPGLFNEPDFIQPPAQLRNTQEEGESVEGVSNEIGQTAEKSATDESSNGIKPGIFGEPAFFQPSHDKSSAPTVKEEAETTAKKGPEKPLDQQKNGALNTQSSNGIAVNLAPNNSTKKENTEPEEGIQEEKSSSEQGENTKIEDTPNETEGSEETPKTPNEEGAPPAESNVPEGETKPKGEEKKKGKKHGKNAAFKEVISKVKGVSEEQKQHDPSEQLSGEAQQSATAPINEQASQAQAGIVNEMEAQAKEPKEFSAEVFKAKLMKRINAMDLPKNLEEADEFKGNNELDNVNKAALGDVKEQKEATVGNIDQATNKPPNPDAVPPKEVVPLRPVPEGEKPKSVSADKAVPDKRPNSEVSQPIQENTQKLDDTMAENEVTDKQLEISEEPSFVQALDSKGTAKENAKTGPAKLRQQENSTLAANAEKAEGTSQEQLEGMNMLRGTAINKVVGGQQQTASKDTTERQRIATEINKIYENAKKDVNTILDNLDKAVASKFKAASDKATAAFENYCARKMAAYKRKRYSGVIGKGKWLKDLFMSLPDEVNQFYVDGRKLFKKVMESEITAIAELVATKLNEAKTRVEKGKTDVTEYVDALPSNLKSLGKEAADEIQDKFDELTESVDSKQDDLIDTIATEYQASLDAVDSRIEEMKAANRGLVDKAMDMVKGVIETIKKLKEMVSNLLSAISHVVPMIVAAPIKFMKDLFKGIGKGIDMFKANIQKHLMGGLLEWLTGSLGPMGIQIPDDIFSLKGIFSLVMQVLGVGWDYLRLKAVKMMGEPVVNALESGWDMFKNFSKNGVAGIWEYMKDKFGDLKETVMDAIKDMLITKVIEAGIKWLLSLLIPGAGFIKAIMAIKDIIVFFVESAIMLIPAITEAILALAAGSLAGVGKAIELGLSKLISLVIGLFAKLIGLGGLAKKVTKIFKKIRKRVDRAVNKLLNKARKAGRKLMRKLGLGKKEKPKNKEQHDEQVKAGLAFLTKETTKADKDGNKALTKKEAKKAAKKTKSNFKVFKSITPKMKNGKWSFEWKASHGELDSKLSVDDMDEDWEEALRAKQKEVHDKMQTFVPALKAQDGDARIKIRGSLATGVKLRKKTKDDKTAIFDPDYFDIDAYIVSKVLFDEAEKDEREERKGQVSGTRHPVINNVIREMRKALGQITGNKDAGDLDWRFTVVIRTKPNERAAIAEDKKKLQELGYADRETSPIPVTKSKKFKR